MAPVARRRPVEEGGDSGGRVVVADIQRFPAEQHRRLDLVRHGEGVLRLDQIVKQIADGERLPGAAGDFRPRHEGQAPAVVFGEPDRHDRTILHPLQKARGGLAVGDEIGGDAKLRILLLEHLDATAPEVDLPDQVFDDENVDDSSLRRVRPGVAVVGGGE